jgi:hypothetical protein
MYILNKHKYLINSPIIASATMAGFILSSNINKFINNSIYWSSGCFNKLSSSLGSIIGDKLSNYINNYIPVESISFDKPSLELSVHSNIQPKTYSKVKSSKVKRKTLQLTTNILPLNATNNTITWTSSNNNIATVNSSGLLTLTGKGTITITASLLENGLKTICIINIL